MPACIFEVDTAPSFASIPSSIEGLGVPEPMVLELFLKHTFNAGVCTLRRISRTLKLPVELVERIFHQMKLKQLIEVKGTFGEDFSFSLSQAGRSAALERMQISRYAGPVPVPLAAYEAAVRAQVSKKKVTRQSLSKAYSDLTLDPDLIRQLGPALYSQRSMFLFGPSGTGKSALAERLLLIYDDRILVPYAVEVDGSIIAVYDPAVHRGADADALEHDPRWVSCQRPCIIVGGELVPEMLELQRDSEAGSYVAPLHMKANNGVFVIDDFGRQMISPRDLLNRWIVPLDRRLDFLALSNGSKFAIPFEVFIVFSTNLNPAELADEAFLRRIPNKILVDAVSPCVFDEILRGRLASYGWDCESGAPEYLRDLCADRGGDLRPCYPRDIFRIIESIAGFEDRTPVLNRSDIDRAAELYFGKCPRASAPLPN